MFKKILIPISSEYYNRQVLKRAVFLADKFKSSISLVYIIEKKTIDQTGDLSDTHLTEFEINQTKKQMMKDQVKKADTIIFDDAKAYFKEKNIKLDEKKIVNGEFSDRVKFELEKKSYDLILMGFEKECLLKYRILDDVDIPIWIEEKSESNKILAICSNLAQNKKVPKISVKLSDALGWDLHMMYIVDTEDHVEIDEKGKRTKIKPERDLLFKSQNFVTDMQKKGVNIQSIKGVLEKEIAKAAEKINPGLVILGREQKKKGILGLPKQNVKRKIAEKCGHSILFVN